MNYVFGSAVSATAMPTTGATAVEISAGASGQAQQLLAYLYEPVLSPWMLLLVLQTLIVGNSPVIRETENSRCRSSVMTIQG